MSKKYYKNKQKFNILYLFISVYCLGFIVYGLGFRVYGLGVRV
jgi:hypothetical protein